MRLGIDCRTILNPGFGEQAGVGHYTYFLTQHLLRVDRENEYVLFFDEQIPQEAILELIAGRPKTTVRRFPFYAYRRALPFIYSHLLVPGFIARERLDLFHAPGGQLPFFHTGRSVITIHDLAIFDHPEWFPESTFERFLSTRILLPRAVQRAAKIIVPSKSTAKDLMRIFKISDQNISIIPHGVISPSLSKPEVMSKEELCEKYHLGGRYLLYLGTIEPRKNIPMLIRAFGKLRASGNFDDLALVIAGARGWKYDEVFEEIEKINQQLAPQMPVKYVGYVTTQEKLVLMKNASGFIYPSRYEGFGLPVLEAMSLGTPVITCNTSSLPEVVGEAGILIDPNDEDELVDAMKKLLNNDPWRVILGQTGQVRATEFTWTKTAEQTLKVYQNILEK